MIISFLGDIALNNKYIEYQKKGIDVFSGVESVLKKSDFVVGNLECMAKGDFGENHLKKPRLATTIDTLNYLKNINLSLACLAQNHVYDHLEDGFIKTTEFLKKNNIRFIGAGFNEAEIKSPVIIDNGFKIAILNYVTTDTNPSLPENAALGINIFNLNSCIYDIKNIKSKVDYVFLSLHWGGRVEGSMYPDWNQPSIARKLIDEGADLIIGHHSHTLQPYEIYNSKYIFYSLGNFCFADLFIDGKKLDMDKSRTNNSAIVNIILNSSEYYEVQIIEIDNCDDKPVLSSSRNKIKTISENTILYKYKLIWKIYFFYEKKIYPILAYFFANNRNQLNNFQI
jgi:poly-gamma-glutamate capsule biosynthesis protein CapA/YwtB (metallophosphatase superfamily)